MQLEKNIKKSRVLILCKSELFMIDNEENTIDTEYPCSKDIAILLAKIYKKEIDFG